MVTAQTRRRTFHSAGAACNCRVPNRAFRKCRLAAQPESAGWFQAAGGCPWAKPSRWVPEAWSWTPTMRRSATCWSRGWQQWVANQIN